MNERERRALEQAVKQIDILAEQLNTAWGDLKASTNDNGLERNDAMVSIVSAHGYLLNAAYALQSGIKRLTE